MQPPAIQLQTTPDRFILTFNRAEIGQSDFLEMLQWLRLRYLLQKADFDPSIEEEGEAILGEWWEQNKHRFIPKVEA